ncbi:Spc98 family-domain-containing protein [Delphinella strobiligena]|nr:Spc98 family-domain-containing protein [Delphinella strobiligena]
MAHAATLSSLTDGLIESVTGCNVDKDARRFKLLKDAALKTLRSQLHPRVNQFDVQSRYEGLEEKFIILNREPLADALHDRLNELSKRPTKWTPELLSLILALSDRPAEKTDLSVLNKEDDTSNALPQLTWADIIAEDPLTEEGIWDDVAMDSDDSDEENSSLSDESINEDTTSTQASSLSEEGVAAFTSSFIIPKNDALLDDIQSTQSHLQMLNKGKHMTSLTEITEFQTIREVLLMLRGLPTTLFVVKSSSEIYPQSDVCTKTCDPSTFSQVVHSFADLGSRIRRLQAWAFAPVEGELLQRLKVSVQRRLTVFERDLAQIEQQFLYPQADAVVSLSDVLLKAQHFSRPLLFLAEAIFIFNPDAEAWAILDSLFAMACNLQLTEAPEDFTSVATVFFECLEVYLRPIHSWVTRGKLQYHGNTFFVRLTDEPLDQGSLWHSRFALSKHPDGTVNAPSFIQGAVNRIFTSGKSTMFLEALQLGRNREAVSHAQMKSLDSISIMRSLDDSLSPFASVLDAELLKWIGDLQSHSMRSLHEVLFSRCGLQHTIDVIGDLFLARDGSRFQLFADELFVRIDRNRPWTDRFIITDLAHDTFGSLKCLDVERLSVRVSPKPSTNAQELPAEALDRVLVDYIVPWPVRNIIKDFAICQRAFQASLRVYRAEYIVTRQSWALPLAKSHSNARVGQVLALRQRLIWFINTLRAYFAEITSTTMQELRVALESTPDMDGMIAAYDAFEENLEARLLLRNNLQPIFQTLFGIMSLSEEFILIWIQLIKEVSPRAIRDVAILSQEYERQLHFAIAGLRGVSRVGGEPSWTLLAEKLHLGFEDFNTG